ncbi:MAG: glucose-6-phosphate isomerase [Desulfovibrionaceae bacterium]|nr:glucose-6-phosphate isomerase [Desulfovibrionaceae bacterium]
MISLNWSHSWSGRTVEREAQSRSSLFSGKCEERLRNELEQGTLPFLSLPHRGDLIRELDALSAGWMRFRHMLIVGIGGSSLGGKALIRAFFREQDFPCYAGKQIWFLDNVDTERLEVFMQKLDPAETIVVPISKSGGTIETLAQYFMLRRWLCNSLPDSWRDHLLFVTDARKGYLREEAEREGIASLPVPDGLGGRYSVLSAVGMVPVAFAGLPWKDFLDGAASVFSDPVRNPSQLTRHPSWMLAQWCRELYEKAYSQLIFFCYIPAWSDLGDWFAQLWAESLGKNGRGTMPIPAVGVTDQHSLQQMFLDGPADKGCLFLRSSGQTLGSVFPETIPDRWRWLREKHFGELLQAEALGSAAALADKGLPLTLFDVDRPSLRTMGEVMGVCMLATVLTGWMLEINPLDQPAVELGKRLAYTRLGASEYPEEAKILDRFLNK